MENWRNTAKIYLEFLLFILGVYGPVFFTWLYSAVHLSPLMFSVLGTSLCGLVLFFLMKKL